MPHSKFLLQPLWVAMLAVSHSGLVFAESEKNDAETNTLHSLAPIVVTAQQGNDANGLIVHADPSNRFSQSLPQMAQTICKVLWVLIQFKAVEQMVM